MIRRSLHQQRAHEQRRQNRRIYADPRWNSLHGTRLRVLHRDGWTCRICGNHATICDHHPTPLTQLLEQGRDPFDPATCRALCASCNGRTDGARSQGGVPLRPTPHEHPAGFSRGRPK
jgi:5-methylcytosine-specific restriction endonuclease McrA